MQNETRRLELSNKIKQMGDALIKEGIGDEDYTIAQSGSIMLLMSKLMVNDDDMFIFSELCAMFSAKKILDEQEGFDKIENETLTKVLVKKKKEAQAKKNTPSDEPKKTRGGRKPKDSGESETK